MTYRELVRAIGGCQGEGVRDAVMGRFRALGGSADRWRRQDRAAMAEALTRTEDSLELVRGAIALANRLVLQGLRRPLEVACWP